MKRFLCSLAVVMSAMGLGLGAGWAEEGKSVDTQAAPVAENPAPAQQPAGADLQGQAEKASEPSASPSGLEVAEASVATGIENREPVGAAETFPAGTEKLFCYTKILGGKEGDEIIHRWLKSGEEAGKVILKVNGTPWRTFSSKTIGRDWTGEWTVEILQGENVLKTLKFEIK